MVARYGERVIRQSEVDAKAAEDIAKLQTQLYDLRVDTAERIAVEALVTEAAKRDGKSEDEWLAAKLAEGAKAPDEADMRRLFEQVKGRLPEGTDYEEVRPQLVQALDRELKAKRAQEVFDELKTAAKYTVVLPAPPHAHQQVEAVGPALGDASAPVTIVEFADFQCPYCSRAAATVHRVLAAYPGKVRLVFRHLPLSFHPLAPRAAEAAACADEQGRFWEMHDALFDSSELEPDALKAHATALGLDSARFDECLDSGRTAAVVKRDVDAAHALGISGTPAFFINGRALSGAQPEEAFRKLIDEELAEAARR